MLWWWVLKKCHLHRKCTWLIVLLNSALQFSRKKCAYFNSLRTHNKTWICCFRALFRFQWAWTFIKQNEIFLQVHYLVFWSITWACVYSTSCCRPPLSSSLDFPTSSIVMLFWQWWQSSLEHSEGRSTCAMWVLSVIHSLPLNRNDGHERYDHSQNVVALEKLDHG